MSQRPTDLFISSLKNHKITKQDSFSNMALPKESFLSLFSSSVTKKISHFSGEIQTKKIVEKEDVVLLFAREEGNRNYEPYFRPVHGIPCLSLEETLIARFKKKKRIYSVYYTCSKCCKYLLLRLPPFYHLVLHLFHLALRTFSEIGSNHGQFSCSHFRTRMIIVEVTRPATQRNSPPHHVDICTSTYYSCCIHNFPDYLPPFFFFFLGFGNGPNPPKIPGKKES